MAKQRRKGTTLRAKEYLTVPEINALTEIPQHIIQGRIQRIEPNTNYTLSGLTPAQNEPFIKGKELFWRDPYNSSNQLIRPELYQGWYEDAKKERLLLGEGYKRLQEAAELTGIDGGTLRARLKILDPAKEYKLLDETPVKGEELQWKSLYTDKNALIHPALVDSWKAAVDREKELIAKGYTSPTVAGAQTGLGLKETSKRSLMYGNDEKIGDEELVYRSPHGKNVFIHPSLVKEWKTSPGRRAEKRPPIKPKSIKPDSPDLDSNDRSRDV